MAKNASAVEKMVEKVWKKCGNNVENVGSFAQVLYEIHYDMWRNIRIFAVFVISCGKISTFSVNKIFINNRCGEWFCESFTQNPHGLLL